MIEASSHQMNKMITNIIPKPIPRKSKLPVSLRTHRDEAYYSKAKKKGLTSKPLSDECPIKQWKNWLLIDNEFPYSAAFSVHHMLIPKRKTTQKQLAIDEKQEFDNILDELSDQYDCLLINFQKKQSIKNHFHVHLLTYKENRKKLKL